MNLRPYQISALERVREHWALGVLRVVLVLPTAGGKTVSAAQLVMEALAAGQRVLWLAHRRELIKQAAATLRALGVTDVGIITPHHAPDRWAKVQVASLDTLTARDIRPQADLIVFDEAHHSIASTYRKLLEDYLQARVLGLTATPQRGDKRPLGDLFEAMVIGARYSELLALNVEHPDQGIVPCKVVNPKEYLGSDLAQHPVDTWMKAKRNGLGGPCFIFCRSVEDAELRVREFRMAGERIDLVTGACGNKKRTRVLDDFRAGRLDLVANVAVLTEGTDVPNATVCMLASGCSSASSYLQKVGRVLRPAPGKSFAVLIDLVGVSLPNVYGPPTADRVYSLSGNPIVVDGIPLKTCPKCFSTIASALPVCDGFMPDGSPCRYVFEKKERHGPKIWNIELQWAVDAAGGDVRKVSREHKLKEAQRLLDMARERGYSISWPIQQWTHLFGDKGFPMHLLTTEDKRKEYVRLRALEQEKKWKSGAAKVKFKVLFGHWPN